MVDVVYVSGLLPDRVSPLQTSVAVRAGYGTGGHVATPGLVRFVCVLLFMCLFCEQKLSGKIISSNLAICVVVLSVSAVIHLYQANSE